MAVDQIKSMYQRYLGREADQPGLNYYSGGLNEGRYTLDSIANSMKGSNEYKQYQQSLMQPKPVSQPTAQTTMQNNGSSTNSSGGLLAPIVRSSPTGLVSSSGSANIAIASKPATTPTVAPTQANNPTSQISQLYNQLLGRAPTQADLDYYGGMLSGGKQDLTSIRNEIANSDEANQWRFSQGQTRINEQGGTNPYANSNTGNAITDMYRSMLGRAPDQAGMQFWQDAINQVGLDQARKDFANSAEVKGYQEFLAGQNSGNNNLGDGISGTATPEQIQAHIDKLNGMADNSPGNWQDTDRLGNDRYQSITTGTNAVNRQVNPTTDTVQGQLNGLLQQNNPLMQRAYYQGLDMANSRGLLNSSMASEAAQAAMMDRALPIAQQDASTFFDQGIRNQAVQNQFNLNDRQHGQSAEQAALDRELSREQMDKSDSTLAASTTANTQGKYLDAINQITESTRISINEIEITPGMTQEEKDAMIANTIARRDADLSWVRQLYSNMPTWDFSWFNTQPGQMPSAPGIGE